jgi:hypothetical protein
VRERAMIDALHEVERLLVDGRDSAGAVQAT